MNTVVLVTGARDWKRPDIIRTVIQGIQLQHGMRLRPTLIHGNAQGADSMTKWVARGFGWEVRGFSPDYNKFSAREAPLRRNDFMVKLAGQLWARGHELIIIAFPLTHEFGGTNYTIRKVRERLGMEPIIYPGCECHSDRIEEYGYPLKFNPLQPARL